MASRRTISVGIRYPAMLSGYPQVVAGESTRHGGVSKPPYHSLNLGAHTADDPAAVQENRRRFFAACGFSPEQVASSYQVHGTKVLYVHAAGHYEGYDALITDQGGILLSVTIADCTPVLILDRRQQAVAAIHAGWRGTVGGIVSKALDAMQQAFDTRPADCLAYIGTCIDACDFAVDADVGERFADPYVRWEEKEQKFFVDLKAANRDQLLAAGLPSDQIEISPYSTVTHVDDYFSHRRDKGTTGRMLAVIGRRA